MICTENTDQDRSEPGELILGRSLPALLDEACDRVPNDHAFNQWIGTGWQPLSNQAFRDATAEVALGLLALGLEKGDRVALLLHSNVNFCIVDFGCLLANLVDVPIDLTQTLEHIIFAIQHSEAKALIISNPDLLTQIEPYLWGSTHLRHIIVVDVPPNWQQRQVSNPSHRLHESSPPRLETKENPESICLDIPMLLHPAHLDQPQVLVPQCIQVLSLQDVRRNGQAHSSTERLQKLRQELKPHELATIVYIPSEAGQMQGVMLTHENLSANALSAFAAIADLGQGAQEVALSFLPLNHVLARTLLYGHIYYGHSIYFSSPNRLIKHLQEVRPTVLVTVPLLLEKIYSKILEKGRKWTAPTSLVEACKQTTTRCVFQWALNLAQRFEAGYSPKGLYALLLKLADWLVLSRWRSLFGGRLKYLICGGAALNAELANLFAAVGIPVMHGYGLTQSSAVVCFNRGSFNRAGTVGVPIQGVEVAIASDGEILLQGPFITPGYYKDPAATRTLIDSAGWLHTGDLGEFTQDGFLKITGLKKALFKLSTGKYIAPLPIEQRLNQSPLVERAIVVGSERKYCAMLIVPNLDALHHHAQIVGFDLPAENLLEHPYTLALYQSLVDAANCHLPYWSTVKRFRLLQASLTVENGLLTAAQEINRAAVAQVFASDIDALYGDAPMEQGNERKPDVESVRTVEESSLDPFAICPITPESACPVVAQSLNPRLTSLNSLVSTLLYMSLALPGVYQRFAG